MPGILGGGAFHWLRKKLVGLSPIRLDSGLVMRYVLSAGGQGSRHLRGAEKLAPRTSSRYFDKAERHFTVQQRRPLAFGPAMMCSGWLQGYRGWMREYLCRPGREAATGIASQSVGGRIVLDLKLDAFYLIDDAVPRRKRPMGRGEPAP